MEQLSVRALQERLAAPGAPPVILDVREGWEVQHCALPRTTHIPMGQIPDRITELQTDQEIVVVCHHGVRSHHVAQFLEQQGFTRLYNLRGGIDAWAREIDPTMATY